MTKPDIIVVGASAGGVRTLRALTGGLPSNLFAAVFVVLHVSPTDPSQLPDILNFRGRLPALHPTLNQQIEPGQIYVAPPDHHMVISDSHVSPWRGPKENHNRPSINVLFRSAAIEYQRRVIGVLLSGTLDDGSAGLWWIKRYGGIAIVQDPGTAAFPDMPRNALKHIAADYVIAPEQIGPLLGRLASVSFREKHPRSG